MEERQSEQLLGWSLGGLFLVIFAVSATAQNANAPIQPNELTTTAKAKPPLQLSDEQRRKIQDALVTAHSAQKTPDNLGQDWNQGPDEAQARRDARSAHQRGADPQAVRLRQA